MSNAIQLLDLEIKINDLQIKMLETNPVTHYAEYKAIQQKYAELCREKQELLRISL